MKTQKQLILGLLKTGQRISQLEALNLFGCFRLSDRIFNLRTDGYTIKTDMIPNKDKPGAYAVYSLVEQNIGV